MEFQKKSYPPAEKLEKMVSELDKMHDLPSPKCFKNISRKPENWHLELQKIYRTNRGFFNAIKKTLPRLTYDELNFLKSELVLIEESQMNLEDFRGKLEERINNPSFVKSFIHLLYLLTPFNRPLGCYVLNPEGRELISHYRDDNTPDFFHLLFLRFLCLRTPLFAKVLQHPITLNLGRTGGVKVTSAKEVERAFDSVIKPHFSGRVETSTESVNIRRWLQYFRLLFESEGIFYFDAKQFKSLLVGAVCRFLNSRFQQNGPAVTWESIRNDLIHVINIDPEIIDIEELIELILDTNANMVRWIPSERGEIEFRRRKRKQVLELREKLILPQTETIEGTDFLKMPSIPRIENVDIIRTSKLDDFWRDTS